MTVALAAIVAFAYAAFVPQYRGGAGLSALASTKDLRDYAEMSTWTEFGALHPYALATRLGGGYMRGSTYPGLLGAAGELAGLTTTRPGNTLVQVLGPGFPTDWGFHTGIVIDGYLNSGLIAALLITAGFGALLRAEYEGFTQYAGSLGPTILHCVTLWTGVWVYFESVVVAPSLFQVVVPVTAFMVLTAAILSRVRKRRIARRATGV